MFPKGTTAPDLPQPVPTPGSPPDPTEQLAAVDRLAALLGVAGQGRQGMIDAASVEAARAKLLAKIGGAG